VNDAAISAAQTVGNTIAMPIDSVVSVRVTSKSALNSFSFGLQSPTRSTICTNCVGGEKQTLPQFAKDTNLVFSLTDTTCGGTFLSTDSTHAVVTATGASWTIGWDDAGSPCGSRDNDFNDLNVTVVLARPYPVLATLGMCPPPGTLANNPLQYVGELPGAANNPTECSAEPVNTATGNYVSTTTDVTLPGIGVPFEFTRTYNSADPTTGPMGRGWTHTYNASLAVQPSGDVTLRTGTGQQVVFTLQADGSFQGAYGSTSTLSLSGGEYTLTTHDQLRYVFDSGGRLIRVLDRNGNKITLAYGGDGLSAITDTVGRVITLGYTNSLLTSVFLPDGRSVGYGYTAGALTSVTDMRGGNTTYSYNPAGLLETVLDQNQHRVVKNTYDTAGRVIQQDDGRGFPTTYNWDTNAGTVVVTEPDGLSKWTYEYFENVLLSKKDANGNVTRYGYDANLNAALVVDARGNTSTNAYDSRGNVTKVTDPLGNSTEYTFTALNDIESAKDARGNTTTYEYDASGNLVKLIQPGTIVTTYTRDPAGTGLLKSITTPRQKTTSFDYSAKGELTRVTDPLGHETFFDYDTSGRLRSRTDARGKTWTFEYDAADHLTSMTDPLTNVTAWVFDPVGNLQTFTDANQNVTSYGYDENNNLTLVQAPDLAKTTYTYDKNSRVDSRTDANGVLTKYLYDREDRLVEIDRRVFGTNKTPWRVTRDPNGDVQQLTLPSGATINYSYDANNRLTGITYSDAPITPNVTYTYDANGNRSSMIDSAGQVTYVYDALNRLTSVTRGTDIFAYTYDPDGNLKTRKYPDGTQTTYAYDDANRLSSVTVGAATTSFGYDPADYLTSTTLPNGVVSSRTIDAAGRVTKVVNAKGTTTYSSFDATLDAVGNPTEIVTPSETATYTYDKLNRVTKVCYTATCAGQALSGIAYSYDGVGNRVTETRYGSTSSTTWRYCCGDQPANKNDGNNWVTYQFNDKNWNETADSQTGTFTYDLEGRITSAKVGSKTESYTYDGDGNRLALSTNGKVTTKYLWDPLPDPHVSALALERTASNSLLRRYIYEPGAASTPISMTTGGSDHYYLTDALGSVANVTSSTGATEWSYTYEPFGTLRSATSGRQAPTNLIRFMGQLFDATTGYYDLRAREYDSINGRFLQPDPLAPPVRDPAVSPYIYANDRPTVLTDPSGMGAESKEGDGGCGLLGLRCAYRFFMQPRVRRDVAGCIFSGARVFVSIVPLEAAFPPTAIAAVAAGCAFGVGTTEALHGGT
jgi:RHS repeat-associated protein